MKVSIVSIVVSFFFVLVTLSSTVSQVDAAGLRVRSNVEEGSNNEQRVLNPADEEMMLDSRSMEQLENNPTEEVFEEDEDEDDPRDTVFGRFFRGIRNLRMLQKSKRPPNFLPQYTIVDWSCGKLCPGTDDDNYNRAKKHWEPKKGK